MGNLEKKIGNYYFMTMIDSEKLKIRKIKKKIKEKIIKKI